MKGNITEASSRKLIDQERSSIHKGHLRISILRILFEGDRKGLDIIRRLEEVTDGAWKPSPGSVYPVLQELEEADLISGRIDGRSIMYSITRDGKLAMSILCTDIRRHRMFMDWLIEIGDSGC